ncbi:MAG TPA: arsenite efflux transporter metallochaperone ArsD [Pirellulaceae bacterium]|nr:arsenite efflux transporter metallochaperone ArsD [Pirellulaceae bacterium]
MTIQVFDKPMCCSTGICGPEVDQSLVRFAADLDWLKRQGVTVERFNLSQQPQEFAQLADVRAALQDHGTEALPIIRVDDRIVCQGTYPSRELLASWGHVASQEELPIATPGCCQPGSGCC